MQLFDVNTYTIDSEYNAICLFVSLNNDLAETIINNTNCPKNRLPIGKSENQDNYEMVYEYSIPEGIASEDGVNNFANEVNNKILEIGNSFNSLEEFIKFIKDNHMPADIHNQMTDTFGLPKCGESSLEWAVAHFFIEIASLLTGPAFLWTSIEEDIENGECTIAIQDGKISEITSVDEYNKLMEGGNVEQED